MDSENKQRISLYLDKDTVKRADRMMKEHGYKSRNEFYTVALETLLLMNCCKKMLLFCQIS